MKVAKQKRSEEIANKAQQMVGARQTNLHNEINNSTDQAVMRAMEADREMNKHVVMEHTALGRRNQTSVSTQNAIQNIPKQQTYTREGNRDELNVRSSIQSQLSNNRRRQQVRVPNGQKSISDTERNAVQNQGLSAQARAQQTQANNQVNWNNRSQYAQASNSPMSGITQNPAEELRRRRKLEAKIRELSK